MLKKQLYWEKKWKNKKCGITKGRLRPGKDKNGKSYCVFLKCKHGFYRKTLIEWVKNCPTEIPTCPICRKEFTIMMVL